MGEVWLERGEHVCLIGANGAGKTTLAEVLARRHEPESGRVRVGHNVTLGYLPQHSNLPDDPTLTVLAHGQHATGLSEAKTRALLGAFLFSGEDVMKSVASVSGGEARRLALAVLVTSDANLLILDEPTNHLDVESREALEDALRRFDGTLLVISHDRALLEAVGSRTLVLAAGRLESHPGGWTAYRLSEEERRAALAQAETARPARHAAAHAGRARTGSPTRSGSSARSRRLNGRCARSRTGSPTRPAGPTATARRSPPASTRARSGRSRRPTAPGRKRRRGCCS